MGFIYEKIGVENIVIHFLNTLGTVIWFMKDVITEICLKNLNINVFFTMCIHF